MQASKSVYLAKDRPFIELCVFLGNSTFPGFKDLVVDSCIKGLSCSLLSGGWMTSL